jgi:hypothetical protein
MEPKNAANVCSQVTVNLIEAMTKAADSFGLTEGLVALAIRLEPKDGAATLCLAMAKSYSGNVAEGLSEVLTLVDPAELSRRAAAVASVVSLAGCGGPRVTAVLPEPALEPLPCRLSTPELVELLKQPNCVGPIRRVILDQLENRYRRKFADHWAFVRFAQERKLGLDFTTPPQRPVMRASVKSK